MSWIRSPLLHFLLLGIAIGDGALGGDRNALILALLITWVGGQVLHGWIAMALADAAKANRPPAATPAPSSPDPES